MTPTMTVVDAELPPSLARRWREAEEKAEDADSLPALMVRTPNDDRLVVCHLVDLVDVAARARELARHRAD